MRTSFKKLKESLVCGDHNLSGALMGRRIQLPLWVDRGAGGRARFVSHRSGPVSGPWLAVGVFEALSSVSEFP